MSESAFLTWYEILQDKILSAIDNLIATPVNNLIFFLSMKNNGASPGPDAKHPYPSINNSPAAMEYKELVLVGAILSVIGSIVISFYQSFRAKETVSNYFFFERLFSIIGNNNEECVHLHTAAYFYNPDISPFVLSMRRSWAILTGNRDLKNLEKFLKKKSKDRSKEIVLKEIYKKINEALALFITEQKKYGEWVVEEKVGEWAIKPTNNYLQVWRRQKNVQERENAGSFNEEETKKTFFSPIFNFINSRLDELGRASFVYWIGIFIFYFLPGTCVVAGIVWPPILVAGFFLVAIWVTKSYKLVCGSQIMSNIDILSNRENDQKATIELIAAVKSQIQLDALLRQEEIDTLRYKKVKFREQAKESKLCKDIRDTLAKKSDFRAVKSIFNGFIIGCFIVFFSSWLLTSAGLLLVGLFVTLSPATLTLIGTVVALLTLGLGLSYGIYLAVQKYNEEMKALLDAEAKLSKLEEKYGDIEIPNISLRQCDRLFRRGTTNSSGWTFSKQLCKRFWTGAIRLGTGMLFLKLLPLGTTAAVMFALYGVIVVPAFYPMLVVMLAGGLFFSAWHIYQYHAASKETQALRVMDFFLNRPCDLKTSQSPAASIKAEKNNKNDLAHYQLRNDLLNENEVNFKKICNKKNPTYTPTEKKCRATELYNTENQLRRTSSESSLIGLKINATQNSTATIGTSQGGINATILQNSDFRKRSNTDDIGAQRKRKQGIDHSNLGVLRLNTRKQALFRDSCRGSSSSLNKITLASSPLRVR